MPRKRPEPKPDYDLMFHIAVIELQTTYNQYKIAVTKALQSTWYGDDGNYAELDAASDQREKAYRLWCEVDALKAQVEEYRKLKDMRGEG